MPELDPFDIANAYRDAAGLAPLTTDSKKSKIIEMVYTISLHDADNTIKEIRSAEAHAVGDEIYDFESGLKASVLRVEKVLQRQ